MSNEKENKESMIEDHHLEQWRRLGLGILPFQQAMDERVALLAKLAEAASEDRKSRARLGWTESVGIITESHHKLVGSDEQALLVAIVQPRGGGTYRLAVKHARNNMTIETLFAVGYKDLREIMVMADIMVELLDRYMDYITRIPSNTRRGP